ncbi:MAG: hypothetical protein HKN20_17420 [Gemmatimonadetes bacterium]|nr:hypothetical protein [Gemmatimonadota bacterium]
MRNLPGLVRAVASVAAALLLLANEAGASRWSLGLRAEAVSFEHDRVGDLILEPAGGVRFHVGFDLAPQVPLRLAIHASRHRAGASGDEYQFGGAQLELAYRFRAGSRLQPFLMAAIGGNAVVDEIEEERRTATNGPSSSIGAGLVLPLDSEGEHFAFELGAAWSPLNWNEVVVREADGEGGTTETTVPVEDSGSNVRGFAGVLIHF